MLKMLQILLTMDLKDMMIEVRQMSGYMCAQVRILRKVGVRSKKLKGVGGRVAVFKDSRTCLDRGRTNMSGRKLEKGIDQICVWFQSRCESK
jgi:hypothetical protein